MEEKKKMTISLGIWILLITGVLLNAGAQLLIKAGTNSLGSLVSDKGVFDSIVRVVFQPFIVGGLLCYVISVAMWIIVLSQVPVSLAYPMLSIGYIANAIGARLLFGEVLSVTQMIGIGVIIVGVFLLARGAS